MRNNVIEVTAENVIAKNRTTPTQNTALLYLFVLALMGIAAAICGHCPPFVQNTTTASIGAIAGILMP